MLTVMRLTMCLLSPILDIDGDSIPEMLAATGTYCQTVFAFPVPTAELSGVFTVTTRLVQFVRLTMLMTTVVLMFLPVSGGIAGTDESIASAVTVMVTNQRFYGSIRQKAMSIVSGQFPM